MDHETAQTNAIEVLGDLGLKKYEAECFAALARVSTATAKEISEVADVPRTRVYNAVEQLQEVGLVDVQHSNPKEFRAVPINEATALLRQRFDERFTTLQSSLEALDSLGEEAVGNDSNVWTTTGTDTITRRAIGFVDKANEEIILIVKGEQVLSERLLDRLRAAHERGVKIYLGTLSESVHERLQETVPDAEVFESELEWLQPQAGEEDEAIGRLLLVDRNTLLLSSLEQNPHRESALWSEGVGNGLLVIARRLLSAGLDGSDELREADTD
ncbi:TrmB family transcriptional regulator [Halococcus sediminicola]|uniref:TrmB family transcriptional regulator n=1 Tax=Halococcus sediminicola TaxID=1264579 RepID=UPI000679947B|nr:helix-turn-helix domain-containing protein [Halococcus sediminicola]